MITNVIATGVVSIDGAGVVTVSRLRGCSFARASAGVYTITLGTAVADGDMIPDVACTAIPAAGNVVVGVAATSDTTIQIDTTVGDTAAPTDGVLLRFKINQVLGGGIGGG